MTQEEKKEHAHEFLGKCLAGDVAHAKVLQTLIQTGFTSYENLGISPEDIRVFRALSGIADSKERARVAFRGCHADRVLASFGVIQRLISARKILPSDLIEGDDSMLKIGSDLDHFSKEHATHVARLLPLEDRTQD